MIKLATCMSRLGTESAFEVLAKARALEAQGKQIIHLEIGEPDFDTPPHIIEAACRALHQGATHYTPSGGIPELRREIAAGMSLARGQEISPQQVVVTPGAKPIMFFVIIALAEPGTEVIYPNPGFPIYESMINFVGAKPVPIPLREERDFRFDVDELKSLITERTALVILNSPQNPTGGVLEPEDLQAIAEVCAARDIPVLSDEVYEHILYEGQFASIATYPGMSTSERTIILHGFSKTYAMTGWRVGFALGSAKLMGNMLKLQSHSTSNATSIAQKAAVQALRGPQDSVGMMLAEFERRRGKIVAGLRAIPGIKCAMPEGAFYVYPNVSAYLKKNGVADATALAEKLLDEVHVALVPGPAFGTEEHVRISYAASQEQIDEGLRRLKDFLAKL